MTELRKLYQVEQLPVFQNRMFHSEIDARSCAKGDVVLVQNIQTGLIYNLAFRPELMRYDVDYHNEQAVSQVFQEHLRNSAEVIQRHFRNQSLIEVGCGKGHFLELLQGLGFDITGLDPTYEGSNPAVIKEYFNSKVGLRADGIILRHVLEHVRDPVGFLKQIRDANGGRGKIYIEVPCFDWICDHGAWFDIFYEHVNYFRLSDFYGIFGSVHEAKHSFNGQYLSVVADLSTVRVPEQEHVSQFEFPADFLDPVERFAAIFKTKNAGDETTRAVWGGASKGVIFTLFMERAGAKIDMVIDINPAKQGKYLPATGQRVWSPEDAMRVLSSHSEIFVMNSNYLTEIINLTENKFKYIEVENENI